MRGVVASKITAPLIGNEGALKKDEMLCTC